MWDEIWNLAFLASFLSAAVRMGVPLAYAALGETISQKSGTINIGLEANMLAGAFVGFAAAYKSGSPGPGLFVWNAGRCLLQPAPRVLLHLPAAKPKCNRYGAESFCSGADQLHVPGDCQSDLRHISPDLHTAAPPHPYPQQNSLIGEAFFHKDIITYLLYAVMIGMLWFLKRTVWGLSLVSVGENPQAADTVGLPVFRIKYLAAAFNGLMSGLGGAYLVLGQLGMFSENVTSGRGYIALSLVVFGRRHPAGVCLAALFMGAANALQFKMQALGVSLPIQFFTGLPYILTVVVLFISAIKKTDTDPAALGKPYIRTMR